MYWEEREKKEATSKRRWNIFWILIWTAAILIAIYKFRQLSVKAVPYKYVITVPAYDRFGSTRSFYCNQVQEIGSCVLYTTTKGNKGKICGNYYVVYDPGEETVITPKRQDK